MLRDVIAFVKSRANLSDENALREINLAFQEMYAADDMPNSLYEMTVVPAATTARITLPWYVGSLKAVKTTFARERIILNTPRPYYHDATYLQSPFKWSILGKSSINSVISNATTLTISIPRAETARFTVTLVGPTDNAQSTKEEVVFEIGDTEHETVSRFTDAYITKDAITESNVSIIDSTGAEISVLPNSQFEGLNTAIQILDNRGQICYAESIYNCFDILYKQTTPYLHYPETFVPMETVLMNKVMEWITLPKDGEEQKAILFAEKSRSLAAANNAEERGVDNPLDLATNRYVTPLPWRL